MKQINIKISDETATMLHKMCSWSGRSLERIVSESLRDLYRGVPEARYRLQKRVNDQFRKHGISDFDPNRDHLPTNAPVSDIHPDQPPSDTDT